RNEPDPTWASFEIALIASNRGPRDGAQSASRARLSGPLHLPRIHLALPGDRPAGFCTFRDRLCSGSGNRREQVAEALSRRLPQSRGVPRGLHALDRPTAGRDAGSELAPDRRLLVPARRHSDRRLLPDWRPAGWAVAARSWRRALSRARLNPENGRGDP